MRSRTSRSAGKSVVGSENFAAMLGEDENPMKAIRTCSQRESAKRLKAILPSFALLCMFAAAHSATIQGHSTTAPKQLHRRCPMGSTPFPYRERRHVALDLGK